MSTTTAVIGGSITPTGTGPKNRIHMSINTMDNGYTLSVDRTINDKYEAVELVFTSKPKLLKAIAQFLTIEE